MAKKEKRGKKRSQEDLEEKPVKEEEKEALAEEEGDKEILSEEEDEEENQEEEPESAAPAPTLISDGRYRNKQRCLISCSRGITARFRHLLEDLRTLIPHHKKESKLDPGHDGVGRAITDIAEMRGCNTVLFLECRKRQDAYLWLGKQNSGGPSVRFHVSNIHTMDELKLTGNCMKGSRPILSFDESFNRLGHLKLMKELFVDIFGTPRGHPKSKPFVDRVMCFYYADKKIWVRNYQIMEQKAANAKEAHRAKKKTGGDDSTTSLVEIGPRFVLNPIRIFRGSFGGQALFHNSDFVSPNQMRSLERREKGQSYEMRKDAQKKRKLRNEDLVLPEDPLDSVFR